MSDSGNGRENIGTFSGHFGNRGRILSRLKVISFDFIDLSIIDESRTRKLKDTLLNNSIANNKINQFTLISLVHFRNRCPSFGGR